MDKIISRKLIMVVLTAIFVALNDKYSFGVSEDAILKLVGLISAYVVGQGIADAGAKKAEAKTGTSEEKKPDGKKELNG